MESVTAVAARYLLTESVVIETDWADTVRGEESYRPISRLQEEFRGYSPHYCL